MLHVTELKRKTRQDYCGIGSCLHLTQCKPLYLALPQYGLQERAKDAEFHILLLGSPFHSPTIDVKSEGCKVNQTTSIS